MGTSGSTITASTALNTLPTAARLTVRRPEETHALHQGKEKQTILER